MSKSFLELREAAAGSYSAEAEKSQFGGYRAHLKNPQGKTSYLGSTAYIKPEHAKGEAQAYHDAYFGGPMKANERGAERAVAAYRAKHKQHVKPASTKVDREPKGEYDRKVDSHLKKKYNKESVNEVTDAQLNKTLAMTKNMQQGIDALKKKHGMSDAAAKAAITRLMGKNEAWETDKGIEQKRKVAHDDTSESTAAYAKSEKERQEREARARLTKNDRVKLDKIRAMLAKEKK